MLNTFSTLLCMCLCFKDPQQTYVHMRVCITVSAFIHTHVLAWHTDFLMSVALLLPVTVSKVSEALVLVKRDICTSKWKVSGSKMRREFAKK